MSTHESEEQAEGSSDRRKLLGAVAWAAPIIAASVAAPAFAASEKESPS